MLIIRDNRNVTRDKEVSIFKVENRFIKLDMLILKTRKKSYAITYYLLMYQSLRRAKILQN